MSIGIHSKILLTKLEMLAKKYSSAHLGYYLFQLYKHNIRLLSEILVTSLVT